MSADDTTPAGAPRPFSIFGGGPFLALARRCHLVRASGLLDVGWLVGLAWGPIGLAALFRLAGHQPVDPIDLDISVHARLLVEMPLLVAAGQMLDGQCRAAVHQLYLGRLADPEALDRILDRTEALAHARWVEAALFAGAFLLGQLVLWGVLGATGILTGTARASMSFTRAWYSVIALPLVQFLAARWMWRWAVWTYFLARLSRLPLAAEATHPDRAAGLGCLAWPLGGFNWFVLAFVSVLAGGWGTRLLEGTSTVRAFIPNALTIFFFAITVGCAPLLLFSIHLYRAKRRDTAAYSLWNLDYVRRFRAKWIERAPGDPLGTEDVQSFDNTQNVFQMILTTRLLVFSPTKLKYTILAVLAPMLPLLLLEVPIERILERIGQSALGVLPL
ncbi:MAG: hypothetical protein KF773_17335 [Deltaproteobacteria bacterium]|nr:hypothetical protein [Deltaproteobacteria bacterium]